MEQCEKLTGKSQVHIGDWKTEQGTHPLTLMDSERILGLIRGRNQGVWYLSRTSRGIALKTCIHIEMLSE